MLLVVAMLMLLSVMMTGASYGLPGTVCVADSSSALHHCCAHELQGWLDHGECAEHERRHHCRERMLLMRADARRSDICAPVAVVESGAWCIAPVIIREFSRVVHEPLDLPPLYGGYLHPRRC